MFDRRTVVASIPVGGRPDQVAVGAGFVWATNVDEPRAHRPEDARVTKTVGLGFEPTDLAGERDVWVVGGYDHTVWRIDSDGEARLKFEFAERFDRFRPDSNEGRQGSPCTARLGPSR